MPELREVKGVPVPRIEGHASKIFWVFREDIWRRSPDEVVLRIPSQVENLALAQKVFAEGREKGLVQVYAIASIDDRVAATVWFPKFPDEEVQGWSDGMKLSIARPLPEAKSVGRLKWLCFRLQPEFRQRRSQASALKHGPQHKRTTSHETYGKRRFASNDSHGGEP